MLEFYLEDRVYKFIQEFEIVYINQVYRFFSNEHRGTIKRILANLEHERRICIIRDEYAAIHYYQPHDIVRFEDRLKSIYVMCALNSSEIKWFTLDNYPTEIVFVNNDGVCYAVTVFHQQTWPTKYALFKKFRSRYLIEGTPDPINNIAVIPNESMIPNIRDLGFAYYAIIDNNGKARLFHEDED